MKGIKSIQKIAMVFLSFGMLMQVNAQETDSISMTTPTTTAGLPSEEVEVVKDFQARLAETYRVKIIPELPVVRTSEIPFFYEVNVRGLALNYPPPVIRPIALPKEAQEKFYRTSIKLGYGYPRFSTLQLNSAYDISDNLKVGAMYDHIGARNNNYLPSRFSRHNGEVFAKYTITDVTSVRAGVRTDIESRDLLVANDTIVEARRTTNVGFFAGVSTPSDTEASMRYHFDIDYNRLSILDLDTRENAFEIGLGAQSQLGRFVGALNIDYNRVAYSADSTKAFSSFAILPQLGYHDLQWNVQAGAIVLFENGQNYILPDVTVRRAILGSKLHVSLFGKSELTVNSYRNTLVENPYLALIDTIRNQKATMYGLGLQGKHDKFEYHVEGGYKIMQDQLEYTSVDTSISQNILWNGQSTNSTSPYVQAMANYQLNPTTKLAIDAVYQNYRDSDGNDIFGYYDLKFGASAEFYLLDRKLLIRPAIDLYSNLAVESEDANISFVDLQFDASYQLRDNISLFVDADNIFNSRKARWHQYNALGIAINGGVSIKF